MLTQDQAGDVFDRIKKLSSADEVEVLFSGGRFALTRFANNTIHQNVEEENHVVSVRTVLDGARLGRSPINLTMMVCGGWLNLQRRWRRCSILIQIFCPCRIRTKLAAARARAPHGFRRDTSLRLQPSLRSFGPRA